MTYPKAIQGRRAESRRWSAGRLTAFNDALASGDAARIARAQKDKAGLEKAVAAAQANLEKFKNDNTSLVVSKAAVRTEEPGLISIPLGFLP